MGDQKLSTKALHAGHDTSLTQGTRAVPLYQSTSYVFNNADHAANLFALAEPGYIYTRLNNPTNDVLEQRLASIEGGIASVVTAGGTAAISTTLLTLLRSGDHIVASSSLYGGTYNLLSVMLPRLGITTTFVDTSDNENFEAAVKENTRAFFVESLGNPKLDVLDLSEISKRAKAVKIPFIVDNTVATPALLRPIEHGADCVMHSTTKFIGGHSDVLGGVLVAKDKELSDKLHFIQKSGGAIPSPFDAWLLLRSVKTLGMRVQKASDNACLLYTSPSPRD